MRDLGKQGYTNYVPDLAIPVWVSPEIGPPPSGFLVETIQELDENPYPGMLRMWRCSESGEWSGMVEYTRSNGLKYVQWIDALYLSEMYPETDRG